MLDNIAEANFLPGHETRKANSVRPAPASLLARPFLLHLPNRLSFPSKVDGTNCSGGGGRNARKPCTDLYLDPNSERTYRGDPGLPGL